MNGPKSMLNKANNDSTIWKESSLLDQQLRGFYGYSTDLAGVVGVFSCFLGSFIIKNYSYEMHR